MQVPRHFRPRIISVALAATLAIASAISALAEKKKPAPPLDRFYIVTQSIAPPPAPPNAPPHPHPSSPSPDASTFARSMNPT